MVRSALAAQGTREIALSRPPEKCNIATLRRMTRRPELEPYADQRAPAHSRRRARLELCALRRTGRSRTSTRWRARPSCAGTCAANASLPQEVRDRLRLQQKGRITAEGELIVSSERHRDQERNRRDCVEKLRQMVLQAAIRPRKRRATRPTRGSHERRLQAKPPSSVAQERDAADRQGSKGVGLARGRLLLQLQRLFHLPHQPGVALAQLPTKLGGLRPRTAQGVADDACGASAGRRATSCRTSASTSGVRSQICQRRRSSMARSAMSPCGSRAASPFMTLSRTLVRLASRAGSAASAAPRSAAGTAASRRAGSPSTMSHPSAGRSCR